MPKIDVAAFFGERPKVPPRGLPNEYAVKAQDCQLEGLCCVIHFRNRTAPFRLIVNQYGKF
ncbi:hypothetical protein LC147_12025 [Vibrio harveyi]|uniref:hypothetical protein n=1 Tax=Vibrio harveyi TaxID=669 RepID=UPI003BB54B78